MIYILAAALTFGAMFALDRGFSRLFRSREQHRSGTAVRLKKSYGTAGVLLCVVALLCLIRFVTDGEKLMLACGVVLILTGAGLGAYYLTHGIFYDDDTFLYTTLGKKGVTYRYSDIAGQKLYVLQGGSHLVELFMADGGSVSVQTSMPGAYDFLDRACHARLRQLGVDSGECGWFDPANSCWFPARED